MNILRPLNFVFATGIATVLWPAAAASQPAVPSNGVAISSVAARNAAASPSSGVMSRNTTPGWGKSGMSRRKGQSWSASTGRRLGRREAA